MLAFSIFSGFLTIVLRVYMELVRFFDSFKMERKRFYKDRNYRLNSLITNSCKVEESTESKQNKPEISCPSIFLF